MPVYEYRCDNGHTFEVIQRMSDDPIAACEECGAPVKRVFHPVAVHFKGSGFYTTDYGKKKGAGPEAPAKKDSDGKKDAPAKAGSDSSGSDSSGSDKAPSSTGSGTSSGSSSD
jgi:putative FmdB family regulatory protein